uniref:Si:ch211-193l2.10 n=1 Tax=Myripristis murdjan TaxID=586833 RepID=A0A667XEK4_9TELE
MRVLLTTQSQNCYREQIHKEMLARLAWKSRYATLYPSSCSAPRRMPQLLQLPGLHVQREGAGLGVPPLMRPVSPQTRQTLYRASSRQGRGRSLYLHRRGQKRPEEKFDFPLLLSWEYGWRLGEEGSSALPVVKNTFYSRNGVFSVPAASDMLG